MYYEILRYLRYDNHICQRTEETEMDAMVLTKNQVPWIKFKQPVVMVAKRRIYPDGKIISYLKCLLNGCEKLPKRSYYSYDKTERKMMEGISGRMKDATFSETN